MERSGVDRNRTVVDAVIPPRQSNEARQRDMKARYEYRYVTLDIVKTTLNIY